MVETLQYTNVWHAQVPNIPIIKNNDNRKIKKHVSLAADDTEITIE